MMAGFGPGELQMAVLRHLSTGKRVATLTISEALDAPPKHVSKAASALIGRHYLRRHRVGIYEITPFGAQALAAGRVITSGPIDKDATVLGRSETHGFRDRVWKSMRIRKRFTINDLVTDAQRDEADAINDCGRYIRILRSAGYIVQAAGRAKGTRPGSNGFKLFRLVRNTGPRAPLHRSKLGVVHDFNTGEDVPCSHR